MLRSSLSRLTAAAVACVVAVGCAAGELKKPMEAGPVDTGAGTTAAARKFLEGRWALESFEVFPPGKPPITLKGSGMLSYDDFGNLKMVIQADQASADLLRAAGIDIRDGTIVSEGRTAVNMQNRTLTYVVPGQSGPGPLSLSRPRHWEVQGDLLTLTTKDDAGKPLSVGKWRRSQQ